MDGIFAAQIGAFTGTRTRNFAFGGRRDFQFHYTGKMVVLVGDAPTFSA